MWEKEFLAQALASLHEAFLGLQQVAMSSSSTSTSVSRNHGTAVAFGVAIAAVAGVAVAAAVGGTLLYSRRSHFKRRKKRRTLLTQKQWREAFDTESGRLIDERKLLRKIRFGGIEPSIRTEVWPFLLGFYELESTRAERESEKNRKREVYEDLKRQCNLLRDEIIDEVRDVEETVAPVDLGSTESKHDSKHDSGSVSSEVQREDTEATTPPTDDPTSNVDSSRESTLDCKEDFTSSEKGQTLNQVDKVSLKDGSLKATEDFFTWQRIIRLDAVRMNAEWVPYSPSQANVSGEVAGQLAMNVGLKDDEHLEPCRQHHAARLVAILEAYALYDPETGYCQGMSDLLSPFVALLDEDYEAFWGFAHFMNTARLNYRLDEVGIRRQLNKVSSILKAGDPHLYTHLEKIHAQDCTFVYRMVVVLMRRELSFEQTISLWEVIWADKRAVRIGDLKTSWRKGRRRAPPTNDLLLYVIAAAVRRKRKFIIERCRGMDDILRECNSMAGHLDVWTLLDDARELVSAVHSQIPD